MGAGVGARVPGEEGGAGRVQGGAGERNPPTCASLAETGARWSRRRSRSSRTRPCTATWTASTGASRTRCVGSWAAARSSGPGTTPGGVPSAPATQAVSPQPLRPKPCPLSPRARPCPLSPHSLDRVRSVSAPQPALSPRFPRVLAGTAWRTPGEGAGGHELRPRRTPF